MYCVPLICVLIKQHMKLYIVYWNIEVMLFEKGPLDGGLTGDTYLIERPGGHWHITFKPGILRSQVIYHQPGAARLPLTYQGRPTFYTDIPDNPRDKFLHVIDQINPWCDDSIYALAQNAVHVLVPYTSMNKEHFDNVTMTEQWHNIVTDTRPWYNPLGGNLEQRAMQVSELFPPEAHVIAFKRQE